MNILGLISQLIGIKTLRLTVTIITQFFFYVGMQSFLIAQFENFLLSNTLHQ